MSEIIELIAELALEVLILLAEKLKFPKFIRYMFSTAIFLVLFGFLIYMALFAFGKGRILLKMLMWLLALLSAVYYLYINNKIRRSRV